AGGYVMAEILGVANNPTGTTPLAFAVPEGKRALVILTGTNLNVFADYDDLLVVGVPIAPPELDVGGTLLTVVEVPTGELVNQPARAYFVSNPPTGTIEITPDPDTTTFINVWAIGGERDVEVVDVRGLVSASIANPSVTMQPGGRADTVLCEIAFSGHDTVSAFGPIDGNWTQHTEIDVGAQGVGVYSRVVADGSATPAGLSQTADDALIICVAVAEVAPPAVLTPEGARHAHMAAGAALAAHTPLQAQSAAHAHRAELAALAARTPVAPAPARHTHTAAGATLAARTPVAAQGATHAHHATASVLHGDAPLHAEDGRHLHHATASVLHGDAPLHAEGGRHLHRAAAGGLHSVAPLHAEGGRHLHHADEAALHAAGTLQAAAARHAHTAGEPALTHAVAVLVASAAHAHTAGVPVLMWRHTIAPAAARHRHVAASAELTQDIVLAVADALHAHRAGAATLRPAGWQPLAVEELAMVVTKK